MITPSRVAFSPLIGLLNPHDARARLRVHVSLGGAARRERCR